MPNRFMRSVAVVVVGILLAVPMQASGQDPQGVHLGLLYQPDYRPGLVVLPFGSDSAGARTMASVRAIIVQDLQFSDRFELTEPTAGVAAGPVNLPLWKERGADLVLEGTLASAPPGATLTLKLHDAVYGQSRGEQTFEVPAPGDPGFRMSVHAISDVVVRWATGDPGMAASRIAFVYAGRGSKEILTVDFDGENVQRITSDGSIALSPAWSPDGSRIAYTSYRSGMPILYERDLRSGRDRVISDRDGVNITPSYSPDGRLIAFGAYLGGNTEVVTYDRERSCCFEQQTRGRRYDSLSPTFSPDGRQIAFVSNRLGEPHVYVMTLGGEARLISEYVYGGRGYNTSPDWSPRGSHIAYHSRIGNIHQLVIAEMSSGTRRFLTNAGNNEDPSWAPDGRHVVFSSQDREGGGLFVLDTVSGRIRPLLRGVGYQLPDWSDTMMTH
jgi:TolB protein